MECCLVPQKKCFYYLPRETNPYPIYVQMYGFISTSSLYLSFFYPYIFIYFNTITTNVKNMFNSTLMLKYKF